MQRFSTVLLAVILSVVTAYATVRLTSPQAAQTQAKESAYDRVMRTKTIRCGYIVRPPFFAKDSNTKDLSGIFYDITEEMAKRLSLKVEWVEETTPAEFVVGLQNERFDTVCHGVWLNAQRARLIDFTVPVLYDVTGVFVKNGDTRFDGKHVRDLNDDKIKFSVMEGSPTQYLTDLNFPDAQKITTPQGTTPAQVMLDLAAGKSDMALSPLSEGILFSQSHPNVLRVLPLTGVGAFSMSYPIARGQDEFRQMISNTVTDMQNQGVIDTILRNYPLYDKVVKQARSGYQDE